MHQNPFQFVAGLSGTYQSASEIAIAAQVFRRVPVAKLDPMSVVDGGTGQSTLTANAVLLGEGVNAVGFAVPAVIGTVLTSNGSSVDPTFQAVNGDVSGPLTALVLGTTGVTAAMYGDATHIVQLTLDAKGRALLASNVAIIGVPPGGAAGGDLAGSTYPAPIVAYINGVKMGTLSVVAGYIPVGDGMAITSVPVSGDLGLISTGIFTIKPNVVDNSKLATMPANTIKGNNTGGSASPVDLTKAQTLTLLGGTTGGNEIVLKTTPTITDATINRSGSTAAITSQNPVGGDATNNFLLFKKSAAGGGATVFRVTAAGRIDIGQVVSTLLVGIVPTASVPAFAGGDVTSAGSSLVLTIGAGKVLDSMITGPISASKLPTLDAITHAAADVSINSHKLTNVVDPTAAQDAATKNYVDSAVAAGFKVKTPAGLKTAAALPVNTYNNGASGVGATLTANANGALTVDGTAVSLNQRILVDQEATQANNGPYAVTTLGTGGVAYVLTRTTDSDTGTEVEGGYFFVSGGSTFAGTGWANTNTSAPTMGATAITYQQFSTATAYTAANGVQLIGNQFSAVIGNSSDTTAGHLVGCDDTRLSDKRTPVATTLTSAHVWVGDGSNLAQSVAVTGDVHVNNAGATTIQPAVITNAMLAEIIGQPDGGTGIDTSGVVAGQLLIGVTGSGPTANTFVLNTLTSGSGISIVNADGVITISASAVTLAGDVTGPYSTTVVGKWLGVALDATSMTTPITGQFPVVNGSVWKAVSASQDILFNGTGVATVQPGVVTYTKMQTVANWSVIGNGTSTNPAAPTAITAAANNTFLVRRAGTPSPANDAVAWGPLIKVDITSIAGLTIADFSGTVAIANGGSGQTTAVKAKDAFSVKSTDIAAAATTDISTVNVNVTGDFIHISGAGAVNVSSFGTAVAGVTRNLKFDSSGPVLIYNNPAMILPGSANITCLAGDTATFVSEGGGNWRCMYYQRAAAPPIFPSGGFYPISVSGSSASCTGNANTATTATSATSASTVPGSGVTGTVATAQMPAFTGDVTATAGTGTLIIGVGKVLTAMLPNSTTSVNGVTYAKMQQVAAAGRILGNGTGSATQPVGEYYVGAFFDLLAGSTPAIGDTLYCSAAPGGISVWSRAAAGTNHFVWTSNGPGTAPTWQAAPGSGTVTSFSCPNGVSGALSPLFSATVGTATTTPALSFAQIQQNQNLAYLSPVSGLGNPSWRSITTTDLATSATATNLQAGIMPAFPNPYNATQFLRADRSFAQPLLPFTTAPMVHGDAGIAGQVAWDGTYFYVCYSASAWLRFDPVGGFSTSF